MQEISFLIYQEELKLLRGLGINEINKMINEYHRGIYLLLTDYDNSFEHGTKAISIFCDLMEFLENAGDDMSNLFKLNNIHIEKIDIDEIKYRIESFM